MTPRPPRGARLYRVLTHAYPRSFRREFGDDLIQAFLDRRRELGAARAVWGALTDFLLSVPMVRLEALMERTSRVFVSTTAAVIAAAGVLGAVVFGRVDMALVPLLISGAAALAYRHTRVPYREAADTVSARWFAFVAAGLSVLGAAWAGAALGFELWELLVVSILVGWVLLAMGAALGLMHLIGRWRHRVA